MNKKTTIAITVFITALMAEGYRVFEFFKEEYDTTISILLAISVSLSSILAYIINQKLALYYTIGLCLVALTISSNKVFDWYRETTKPPAKKEPIQKLSKINRESYITANRYYMQELKYQEELNKKNEEIEKQNKEIEQKNIEIEKQNKEIEEENKKQSKTPVDIQKLTYKIIFSIFVSIFFPASIYLSLTYLNGNNTQKAKMEEIVNFTITEIKPEKQEQNLKPKIQTIERNQKPTELIPQPISENEKSTEQPKKDLITLILEDLKSGLSKTAIAEKHGITRSRVNRLIQKSDRRSTATGHPNTHQTPANKTEHQPNIGWTLGLEGEHEATV